MDKEIKRLRKKFFILSSGITFTVIFVMLLVLNILMQLSYNNELKTASDMLVQTAFSNTWDMASEVLVLDEMETDINGDTIIPRNPHTIKRISLNGTISCTDETATWYCAGGGIFFELPDESGKSTYIHKEYKFNNDNTKVAVDFTTTTDFYLDGQPLSTDITRVSQDCFYVSKVWWASTSNDDKVLPGSDVVLELESIEIQYLEDASVAASENFVALSRDFDEIFPAGVPEILNTYECFYSVSDKQNNLIEVNRGNISADITPETAVKLAESEGGSVIFDGTEFEKTQTETDEYIVHSYICNSRSEENTNKLMITSAVSGGCMFIFMLVLIYFMSGRVITPISESYRKQKEFISNASHELKTPITVITATTELMEKKNSGDRLTECISVQAQKMSRLVNEMLTLTRLSTPERINSDFKKFDISRIVENAALYFESRAFEEEKQIETQIQENLSYMGNADKIDELVGILLDNALKYSDDGSVIKMTLKSAKDKIMLRCENPCKNFDTADIPHLFERFYRADKSHSDEKEGFGLGLSIANEIVSLHKGTINVKYKNGIVSFEVVI